MTPGELPPAPFPARLKRISPSRFIGLQKCRLRELWTADHVRPVLPASARARLGTVVHRLLERVGKEALSIEQITPQLWSEELRSVESEMAASWLDQGLLPLNRSVPDAEVHKLRTLERARKMAGSMPLRRDAERSVGGLGFEIWVQSADGLVGGYIDCALRLRSDGLVIRDYKSGSIYEKEDRERPAALRVDYEIQLQMYAGLYHQTFAVWPDRLEIVPLQGDEAHVPLERGRCSQLVQDAKTVLETVNHAVVRSGNSATPDLQALAMPSSEACTSCVFRPQCNAYLTANAEMQDGWPLDIRGTVTGIQSLGNGSIVLSLKDRRGDVHSVRGLTPGGRHPALDLLRPGSQVGVFSIQRGYPAKDLREGSYTTIYYLQSCS